MYVYMFVGAFCWYVSSLLVSDNCSGPSEAPGEEAERVHYRERVQVMYVYLCYSFQILKFLIAD